MSEASGTIRLRNLSVLYITVNNPLDTERKLSEHKTFRRRLGRFLNISCMFNLRLASTGTKLTFLDTMVDAVISFNGVTDIAYKAFDTSFQYPVFFSCDNF